MKPLRYALIATLIGVFVLTLTIMARTGQVDVSSIRPTVAVQLEREPPTPPLYRPTDIPATAFNDARFTTAMQGVEAQFTALSQNTDLLTDEAWRRQTLAMLESGEREANALAAGGHPKHDALLKTAEALRVTRESLVDNDLIGMASGARLLNAAVRELR